MLARRPKLTREENARKTREAIVKAALRVVARHGYARASVSRITQAAGVAQGTLYSYFGSHQGLLDELLPREGEQLLDWLSASASGSADYFDLERRAFRAVQAYMARKPYFLRVLTEAEIAAPQSYAQHMRNVERRYLNTLKRAANSGEIRQQNDAAFSTIARVLSGARGHIAIGFALSGHRNGFAEVPPSAADTYVKFIRLGLDDQTSARMERPRRRGQSKPTASNTTRNTILKAAARVIHELGYAGATVKLITQAAGVAVGTFYTHFASQQEMFDALIDYMREEMLAHVGNEVRGCGSFVEMECRGFYAFFQYLRNNPWFIRIETEAAVWQPAAYERHFRDISRRYVVAMKRGKRRGELSQYNEDELPLLSYLFMASRHYLATRYLLNPESRTSAAHAIAEQSYISFVRNGLAGRSAAAKSIKIKRRQTSSVHPNVGS